MPILSPTAGGGGDASRAGATGKWGMKWENRLRTSDQGGTCKVQVQAVQFFTNPGRGATFTLHFSKTTARHFHFGILQSVTVVFLSIHQSVTYPERGSAMGSKEK